MSYESLFSNSSDNDSVVDYNGGPAFLGDQDNSHLQVSVSPIASSSTLYPEDFNTQYPPLTFEFQPQHQYHHEAIHIPNSYGYLDVGTRTSYSDQNLVQAPGLGDVTNYQRQRYSPYARPDSMYLTQRQGQDYSQFPPTNTFMQDWQSPQNGPMNYNAWPDNAQAFMEQYPTEFASTLFNSSPAIDLSHVPEFSIGPHRRHRLQELTSHVPAHVRAPSLAPEPSSRLRGTRRPQKQKQKEQILQTPTTDSRTAGPSTGGTATALNDSSEGLLTEEEYSALRTDGPAMVCRMQVHHPSSLNSSAPSTTCGESFNDPALAAAHLTVVHGITTKKAKEVVATRCAWEQCKGSTWNMRPLIKGMHRHILEKHFHLKHRCPVRECKLQYTRPSQVRHHLEHEHKRMGVTKPGFMYAILQDVSKPLL